MMLWGPVLLFSYLMLLCKPCYHPADAPNVSLKDRNALLPESDSSKIAKTMNRHT